jgi:Putative zinc-finger
MECTSARQRLPLYVDDALPVEERRLLKRHLNVCRHCALESERYASLRQSLRSLPRLLPPADLTTRLRVVASKVRTESLGGATPWSRWCDRVELSLRNLMRPLALPAFGGLCSAVFLFSIFVPMFKSSFAMNLTGDVPTMLATQPMLTYMAPVAFAGPMPFASNGNEDAVVDLQLDDQGQVVDFTIVHAPGGQTEALRRFIENSMLFTKFSPATTFGHGVAGTIRISFRNSRIDVRG